jgi:uncharacterized repeat protein (TIGR04076 family)
MAGVKITVVKTFSTEDVFGDAVPEDLSNAPSQCGRHRPGEVFIMEGAGYPEGLCLWAFADIFRDIIHLWRGSDYPWVGKPGVMYSSCTDGKMPVVFKVERVED